MTAHSAAPFSARLALAVRMIARGLPPAADHIIDQLDAAGAEVRVLHDRLGRLLPILEPERRWRQRVDPGPSDAVRAYLLAALLGCTTVCVHIRRGGPRPAVARLSLGRVDCERCVATLYRPPLEDADRCDVCTSRGVTTFHPFAVRQGPLLLAGDACAACAGILGIRQEAAS